MVNISEFLVIMLYFLLIVFVIIMIFLAIKLIDTLKRVDSVIDDVDNKIKTLDGIFNIIGKTTDIASSVSDKIISGVSNFIGNVFKSKKGESIDE
ncbi:MAG: hypothetical protein Q4E75_04185 [bacterium]|nr:hypothetical protein [bacterium]